MRFSARWTVAFAAAAIALTGSRASAETTSPATITAVQVCGATVEAKLSTGIWIYADTADGVTTEKLVDRFYALITAAYLSGRTVSGFGDGPAKSGVPCQDATSSGYRLKQSLLVTN